jgi:hypothetical protein
LRVSAGFAQKTKHKPPGADVRGSMGLCAATPACSRREARQAPLCPPSVRALLRARSPQHFIRKADLVAAPERLMPARNSRCSAFSLLRNSFDTEGINSSRGANPCTSMRSPAKRRTL